jgi:hypothetical protein
MLLLDVGQCSRGDRVSFEPEPQAPTLDLVSLVDHAVADSLA